MLTASLLALEAAAAPAANPQSSVPNFMPTHIWEQYLASYPDRAFAEYLMRGITYAASGLGQIHHAPFDLLKETSPLCAPIRPQ